MRISEYTSMLYKDQDHAVVLFKSKPEGESNMGLYLYYKQPPEVVHFVIMEPASLVVQSAAPFIQTSYVGVYIKTKAPHLRISGFFEG